MAYPAKLLTEDESLVFDLHPHWKALAGPLALAVLIVFGAAFAASKWDGNARKGALGVGLVLLVVLVGVPFLKWRTTHFVLTTKRVVMRKGVLSHEGRDVPIFRINDVSFKRTFWERILGAGTLIVESGGESGQVTLNDIPHVDDVQREIYRLIEADNDRRGGGGPAARAEA